MHSTVWKNEKFTLTCKKKISWHQLFSKTVTFTIFFCKNCVRVNFSNFHTVHKLRNFTTTVFSLFCQIKFLLKSFTVNQFDGEKICVFVAVNFSFLQTVVWKLQKNLTLFFGKNFVKVMLLLKRDYKRIDLTNFFHWENILFCHTVPALFSQKMSAFCSLH